MFIGHYAVAFAAAAQPRAPGLGTLFIATQAIDYGFFGLMLLDIEHMRIVPGITAMNPMDLYDMPWTHSLVGALGWGAGFALLMKAFGWHWRGALIGGAVVVSHWFVDLLVHRPDLTLAGSPPGFGLGLWNAPLIAMPLELGLCFGSLAYYVTRTRLRAASAIWAVAVLALALLAVQAIDWFGPPPARVGPEIALTALTAYTVLAALAAWVSTTRAPATA